MHLVDLKDYIDCYRRNSLECFSLRLIRKWLNNQDNYSLLKEPRHRFQIARGLVTAIDEQFEANLSSLKNLKKFNVGVRFFIIYYRQF